MDSQVLLAHMFVHAVLVSSFSSAAGPRKVVKGPSTKTRLLPSIQELSVCTDKKHGLHSVASTTVLGENGDEFMTVKFKLTSPTKVFTSFRVFIHRCSSAAKASCEYFTTWSWDIGVCELVSANGTAWSPIVQSISPKFHCPVRSGSYSATNTSLDIDSVEKMTQGLNLDKFNWRVEFQLFNDLRALYLCAQFAAKFNRVKKRKDH